jgi:hypothetical protein
VSVGVADGYVLGTSVVLGTAVLGRIDGRCDGWNDGEMVGVKVGTWLGVNVGTGVGTGGQSRESGVAAENSKLRTMLLWFVQ